MASADEASIVLRREAMSVLSRTPAGEIATRLAQLALPPYENLRGPESGLVMLRGRIGGDGAPFNLGEASVAHAAVRLAGGEVGFGYTLGRDGEKARLIALCDALIQSSAHRADVERHVVKPLLAKLAAARIETDAETAATRVDFYTLVRGDN